MITICGTLADPAMIRVLGLSGSPATLSGRLSGGGRAGLGRDGWPMLVPGRGAVPALACEWTPALARYTQVFGLTPQPTPQGEVLGIAGLAGNDAPPAGQPQPVLAAAIADHVIRDLAATPADRVAARLPQLALWVASRLRAAGESHPPLGPHGSEWELLAWNQPYADYFSVEELRLRHRLNAGGWSERIGRAVFVSGDATVLLPWDPLRDRVLLVDQFRAAPAARGDREPWLCETVAGRIDAGETPEQAARREAWEEARIRLGRVFEGPHHYPSPGAVAEMLYLFIGIADLPDGVAGVSGLEAEHEDIRSHVVDRTGLMAMIDRGEVRNGPLLMLALWLDRHAGRLRAAMQGG
ncbi:NUDIX domain-containing protein [uncultured Paracoccus sp.]|uniref:NUDIX domain-containing protein n=1 Tax=uncultured Paracoccus sp. TaxID=189685 RepID=UPI0025D3D9CF|nr:NUDIX domain-containing protein [uncultured Paracoccus sp.]